MPSVAGRLGSEHNLIYSSRRFCNVSFGIFCRAALSRPGPLPGGSSLTNESLENKMDERINPADGRGDLPGVLRSWVMIALTLIFVLLYALALTGWLKPLADERMIARLE